MKIIFLGTGTSQGIPVIACKCEVCHSLSKFDKRLRSSILIELDNNIFVIDTGPDFRQQMLRENVQRLDAVILTHGHKDHIAGMDDVRAFNYIQKGPVDIYLRKDVADSLKSEFSYAFADIKYPGIPELNLHEISNGFFNINGIQVLPINVMHYKLPIFGFRINKFAYITDISSISDEEMDKLNGLSILVLGALRKKKHFSHLNLEEALMLIDKLKPKQAYLTHISHLMGFPQEVTKELPENVFLAYDGLILNCE